MKTQQQSTLPSGLKAPVEEVKIDFRAVARLAQGTAVVIATLLAIPDAVALLPASPDLLSWFLRLVAVWLSALILWFVSYLCLIQLVAWFSGGVKLGENGVKLWRFGRLISWESIKAVGIEQQQLFSRLFSLNPVAHRLTLFVQNKPGARIQPHALPSFLFSPQKFDRLVSVISQSTFGFSPDSRQVLIAQPGELPRLRTLCLLLSWARIAVSVLIAVGLISFLGRKAAVNYYYNSANSEFRAGNLESARKHYRKVTRLDPLFAVAWQNLGGTEWRLGHTDDAIRYWQRSIILKPDLVESKVSLSFVYMHERKFDLARDMINRALKVAPKNIAALTNQADLDMREGHIREAIRAARLVLTMAPNEQLAACLIAQGRLRLGNAADALAFLDKQKSHPENEIAFCRLIRGECHLALGDLDRAEKLFESVIEEQSGSSEALIDLARVKIRRKELSQAEELLLRASSAAPADPWPLLLASEVYKKQSQKELAIQTLKQAIALPGQDAASLAQAAQLSLDLGNNDQASALAKRSFRLEPETKEALWVLEQLAPQR